MLSQRILVTSQATCKKKSNFDTHTQYYFSPLPEPKLNDTLYTSWYCLLLYYFLFFCKCFFFLNLKLFFTNSFVSCHFVD